jgi:hypothetical protein
MLATNLIRTNTINRNTPARITQFIREWIKDTIRDYNYNLAEVIRAGIADVLAVTIWKHFDFSDKFKIHTSGNPEHTWIEYNGLHYDMENPEGVKNWKKLDYFKGHPDATLDADPEE